MHLNIKEKGEGFETPSPFMTPIESLERKPEAELHLARHVRLREEQRIG
jgi:hypothetical protein